MLMLKQRFAARGGFLLTALLFLLAPAPASAQIHLSSGPGWYWPNVHWPSRDFYFTYGVPTGYRVFYPSDPPVGFSYYVTFVGRGVHVTPKGPPGEPPYRAARIDVWVPEEEAEVWFDDFKTAQLGSFRQFQSTPLVPDGRYRYTVRARWLEEGKVVTRTQTATFGAGDVVNIDFRPREAPKDAER